MLEFLIATYLLSLVKMVFNRQST